MCILTEMTWSDTWVDGQICMLHLECEKTSNWNSPNKIYVQSSLWNSLGRDLPARKVRRISQVFAQEFNLGQNIKQ